MKYLIDAHNTISAGTINVTKSLVEGILRSGRNDRYFILLPGIRAFDVFFGPQRNNVRIISVPQIKGVILQLLFRIIYQVLIFPFWTLLIRPDSILVLGNYSIFPWRKKVVLLQTPYIVDDRLFRQSDPGIRLEEGIVRFLFSLTLPSAAKIIVQHELMKEQFLSRYGRWGKPVFVLSTPVSDTIAAMSAGGPVAMDSGEKIILYPSRFYRHKNHEFILRIAGRYAAELNRRHMKFCVTIDGSLSGAGELIALVSESNLESLIENIGEVPQDRLREMYMKSAVVFFPSKSESFGLPLVEAMAFGLPVVVPDLAYAHAVCGDAGIYFEEDNADEAYRRLERICEDPELWKISSEKSRQQYKKFPTVDKWVEEILKTIQEWS